MISSGTYHRYTGTGSGFTEYSKPYWEPHMDKFESVSAPDKYTVVFKQKKVDPTYLITAIMQNVNFIYAPEIIKQHGDAKDWRNLVGTGPFEITEVVEGTSTTWMSRIPTTGKTTKNTPRTACPTLTN